MTCEQARECVDAYINNTLPENKQEAFIRHVKSCPECFQDLETYFIVDVAIKYFDKGKDDTYDISNLLQKDLDRRLMKHQNKRWMMIMLIIVAAIVVTMSIGLLTNWFGWAN